MPNNRHLRGACIALFATLLACSARAQEGAGFRPSPGLLSMIQLGGSGLLTPLLSEDVFASQAARMGDARVDDGFAEGQPRGFVQPHYRDQDWTTVGGLGVIKEIPLPTGAAFLRVAATGAWSWGSSTTPIDNQVQGQRVEAQLFYSPVPKLLLGMGVSYDHVHVRSDVESDPLRSYSQQLRPAAGLQFFYAQSYNSYIGVAAKSELQRGNTAFSNIVFLGPHIPPFQFGDNQNDDRYYFEANVVGTLARSNVNWMPGGWALHPLVGMTYQRNRVDTVLNTLGQITPAVTGIPVEEYGLLMTNLRFEKTPSPSPRLQALPEVTIGLEHEYDDNLAIYVHEPNYAVVGAGCGFTVVGQRVDVDYKLRQGFHDNRSYQGLAVTTSLFF